MKTFSGMKIGKGLCALTCMFLIVLSHGISSAESPFGEKALDLQDRIKTTVEKAGESIESLKKTTNAVTGKFVAVDLGPLTLTIWIPENEFPQVSLGVTGATKSTSISNTGEICRGQSVKGGGGIYGTATAAKCENLIKKNEKKVSVAAGVGVGAGADAASVAITAGGFVKVPFDMKKMLDDALFPQK